MKLKALVLGFAIAVSGAHAQGSAYPSYYVLDVGLLPAHNATTDVRINDSARAYGTQSITSQQSSLGFRWDISSFPVGPRLTPVPFFGGGFNNDGAYTGSRVISGRSVPFLQEPNRPGPVDINNLVAGAHPPLATAPCLNDFGAMVVQTGIGAVGSGNAAYLLKNGRLSNIGSLGGRYGSSGTYTNCFGISRQDEIVGSSRHTNGFDTAFYFRGERMWALGSLYVVAHGSVARAISPNGKFIVGSTTITAAGKKTATIWVPLNGGFFSSYTGTYYDCEALGVNDDGSVVGTMVPDTATPSPTAFIYGQSFGLRNLDQMRQFDPSWVRLEKATSINANGVIAGTGLRADGTTHAFVALPLQRRN
jgi:uncharacterized membrane protein